MQTKHAQGTETADMRSSLVRERFKYIHCSKKLVLVKERGSGISTTCCVPALSKPTADCRAGFLGSHIGVVHG